ncbi:hypothetical protein N0V83_001491 [Neocucurbitaria cava]|uniref:Uncharacterized protein n=1 Tax=Neocucurbitaria cava TaxID=798079 RepID=A0A9W9CRA4_9PLEO|nr:hypothetical protein N0V83_001491 [Neocucurbitaria cava]
MKVLAVVVEVVVGVVELVAAELEELLLNAKLLLIEELLATELLLVEELLATGELLLTEELLATGELLLTEELLATGELVELPATEELNPVDVDVDDLEDVTDEELLILKALHCPKPFWHVVASQ